MNGKKGCTDANNVPWSAKLPSAMQREEEKTLRRTRPEFLGCFARYGGSGNSVVVEEGLVGGNVALLLPVDREFDVGRAHPKLSDRAR